MTNIKESNFSIKARSITDIQNVMALAMKNKTSVFVTSGGWNWGYGENQSVNPDRIHLDLSLMKKILHFNPESGVIRIEPGVTQGDLEEFLTQHQHDFYVPNTGAGRRGSILGNALERGFGISPVHDHAESILSLKGVLSDGSIYESALSEINPELAESFTWGVGPQLDKLVTQSSWIVVTEASIQLVKKAPCTDIFLLPLKSSELAPAIDTLRKLLQENYVHIGSIKIFNKKQIQDEKGKDEWFATLVIYSHPQMRKASHRIVKKYFEQFQNPKKLLLSEKKTRFLKKLLSCVPTAGARRFSHQLDDFLEMFKLAEGGTSEVGYRALEIGYDYKKELFEMETFNKKLIWFSPLCVLKGDEALKLMNLIKKLDQHEKFKFNTFTWTVLNKRTLAMVIPILLPADQENDFWPWFEAIHLELKKEGFIPYRFHIRMMGFLKKNLVPSYFRHVEVFEKAFDPDNVIQSDKYS